jgi:hypothetical protein
MPPDRKYKVVPPPRPGTEMKINKKCQENVQVQNKQNNGDLPQSESSSDLREKIFRLKQTKVGNGKFTGIRRIILKIKPKTPSSLSSVSSTVYIYNLQTCKTEEEEV